MLDFNRAIIDATCDMVCAYKPNLAFYEAQGAPGLALLQKTIEYIPGDIPVIGDAKRGDIGNTARAYAHALFSVFAFDAVTVNPYLGRDSVEAFTAHQDRGVFLLCRTSNSGAGDFQELHLASGPLLYEVVAQKAGQWNAAGNVGLVVGATCPAALKKVRSLCPEMLLLIPGTGAQGGGLEEAVLQGTDSLGEKAVFNVSRQVLYASAGKDFARAARREAERVLLQIRTYQELKRGG
jgi:orotidine-5'-phosphate decarboxylase